MLIRPLQTLAELTGAFPLMSQLRDMGNITGGPPAFQDKDRSRFLHRLDETIVACLRIK